jgi:CRISPR-associated endonuclease/helicase Cas3
MTSLGIEDFPAFFAAVNDGRAPFPWQQRLASETARRVFAGNTDVLPSLLDIPTGAGKTSIIDVVTFLQALESELPAGQRLMPRRTVFVVDRRVIVDQVDEHAQRLAEQLRGAIGGSGVLGDVARALASVHGRDREPPLRVGSLRGGIARDETWARRPDVPVVLSSTIDQVGSRLLFRGYGLSDGTKPLQAGLLGTDTLFVLDEVHLSIPFAETLRMLGDRYIGARDDQLPRRWQVVQLSATAQVAPDERVFTLGAEDRDPEVSPVLSQRLSARKPAELVVIKVGVNDDARFAKTVAQQVQSVMAGGEHRRVLVVCNRVARAAACADELSRVASSRRPGELAGTEVELLTGRMRAVERDAVLARVKPAVQAGSEPPKKPIIVVSTQSIEAGADFDFDALVTECASLDALRQRFGRVDRLGECSQRGMEARAVVLCREADAKTDADDPLYGPALGATWRALEATAETDVDGHRKVLDFGAGFPAEMLDNANYLPPQRHAPWLFAQHLDAWSQTSPIPDPDPDPSLWLHGLDLSDPDVALVWRADVTSERLALALGDEATLAALVDSVAAIPPGPSESLSLPVSHVRAWLAGQAPTAVADADSAPAEPPADEGLEPRLALVWRGESTAVLAPNRIRPGDVLVIPSDYGGIGALGTWDPRATGAVMDVAEVDQVGPLRSRPVLRLNEFVLGVSAPGAIEGESSAETLARLRAFCRDVSDSPGRPPWWPEARRATTEFLSRDSVPMKARRDDVGWILTSARRALTTGSEEISHVDESSEGSSFAAVQVSLSTHTSGVADTAVRTARNCGLSDALVADLALAAHLHDIGKLDPRFQSMLAYPDAAPGTPLGKSQHGNDRALRARARAMSGLPDGFDHAVAGVAILERYPELLASAHDPDLVRHLVGSHHGQCRPFAKPVVGVRSVPIRASWGDTEVAMEPQDEDDVLNIQGAERFFRVRRRYGWYGLAYLEALLRLSDWTRSEDEQLAGGQ